jgi:hypothetical protein
MPATVNEILREALLLSPASRANLAEKLIESIEADIEPALEKAHLEEVRRRRQEVGSGAAQLIPGDEALRKARGIVRQ